MLSVFHTSCMEHSLHYYAIGGITLGAARYKVYQGMMTSMSECLHEILIYCDVCVDDLRIAM